MRVKPKSWLILILFLIMISSVTASNLTTNLVACYDFEGNGNDVTGRYNATAINGATYGTGRIGQAASLDGVDDAFNVTVGLNLTYNYTVIAWINAKTVGASNQGRLLRQGISTTAGINIMMGTTTRWYGEAINGSTNQYLSGNMGYLFNNWTMVSFITNGTYSFIIQNATNVSMDKTDTGKPNLTNNHFLIGNTYTVNRAMNGSIDTLVIYNKTGNNALVTEIFNNSAGMNCTQIWATGYPPAAPIQYDFYFSQSGNDATGNGSQAAPYKTISKLNNLTLPSNSTIYFNGNDVWNQVSDAYISFVSGNKYTSYGTGKAIFDNSINASLSSYWSNTTTGNKDVWVYNSTIADEIGNTLYNNDTIAGGRNWTTSQLNVQGAWVYNKTTDLMYIYSVGNPATYYNNVLLSSTGTSGKAMFWLLNKNNITIDGLELRHSGSYGVLTSGTYSNIVLINNKIHHIGGKEITAPGREGNGIEFYEGFPGKNVLVNNNTIYETFDACISPQGYDGNWSMTNFTFTNNTCYNNEYGFEIYSANSGGNFTDIYVNHNTFVFNGYTLFSSQRIDLSGFYGYGIRNSRCLGTCININITDNIVAYAKQYIYYKGSSTWTNVNLNSTLYQNNNLYFDNHTPLFTWTGTTYNNVSLFSAATGKDVNSSQMNPAFLDMYNYNFIPSFNSPACTISRTGSYVGAYPCQATPTMVNISNVYLKAITIKGNSGFIIRW